MTESLVKSIKHSLTTAIGERVQYFNEFQTTIFECAQLVNQRPIGRHPTEPENGSYLYPNELIIGGNKSQIAQDHFHVKEIPIYTKFNRCISENGAEITFLTSSSEASGEWVASSELT